MDPILILVASIFAILLVLLIVNLYYIHGHYFYHTDHTTTATQMFQNPRVHSEIQTENCSHAQDKEVQNTPQTENPKYSTDRNNRNGSTELKNSRKLYSNGQGILRDTSQTIGSYFRTTNNQSTGFEPLYGMGW